MTVDEARQNISTCEAEIKSAYQDLLRESREVSSKGMSTVWKQKTDAENAAQAKNVALVVMALLAIVIGIILSVSSHPVLGFLIAVAGGGKGLDEFINRSKKKHPDEGVAAADKKVKEVESKQSILNTALENNKSI